MEFASAVTAAGRHGRITGPETLLQQFDDDCAEDGPLTVIGVRADAVLPRAYDIVRRHRVRTLDAMHLTVASVDAASLAADTTVVLITRDDAQAEAAGALGIDTG